MIVTILAENSICENDQLDLNPEHGLCIHIEMDTFNILFDVGKSDLFIRNAKKLNIDLSKVDFLIISHGHFDHGGGLKHFFKINDKAKVFMHKKAVGEYYTKILGLFPYYIGLDNETIRTHANRIVFIDKETSINENIFLIDTFPNHFPGPKGNLSLYEKQGKNMLHDEFKHEIALIFSENNKSVLFTGCSHSGIINMYEQARTKINTKQIDYVFGGFHTYNPVSRKNESKEYLDILLHKLMKSNSFFYTGHCTGNSNLNYFKKFLKNKIHSMNTGDIIEI